MVKRRGSDVHTVDRVRLPLAASWAEPDEVGPVVLFLCGQAAGFMVGASVKVDGGYTVR